MNTIQCKDCGATTERRGNSTTRCIPCQEQYTREKDRRASEKWRMEHGRDHTWPKAERTVSCDVDESIGNWCDKHRHKWTRRTSTALLARVRKIMAERKYTMTLDQCVYDLVPAWATDLLQRDSLWTPCDGGLGAFVTYAPRKAEGWYEFLEMLIAKKLRKTKDGLDEYCDCPKEFVDMWKNWAGTRVMG
jgi:hypothetical protein